MKNPFVFGKVVDGDNFLDREDDVASILETLIAGQNVICYSPRRYGKTSMMMRIKDTLADRGHMVFFIDLFRVTSLEDLYNIYATSIAGEIQSPLKTMISIIQTILPTINPKIVFKSPESPTVEISAPLPLLSKSATLHELFESLEKFCVKKHKNGTVIFDEFQEVATIPDGEIIEKEMRSAFQHHTHVSYVFLGSKQNLLKGIFRNNNRPFYNFGRHFELDVIGTDHWKKFIGKHFGPMCPAVLIDKITSSTGNHPYYTQMYCHYLWEYAKKNSRVIDEKTLEIVLREILERESMLFAELWDSVSMKERHLLKAIAAGETKSLYEKRFVVNHNLGTASSIQKAAGKLLKLDYIRKVSSEEIKFVNPFFKQWVNLKVSSIIVNE